MLAGPLYILVGLAQVLTREGFDMRRHALSLLSNGDLGWIQVSNFLICGTLVICGAVGCRSALRASPAGVWGPILLAVYGVGLIGAGVFAADPGNGFPPGAPPLRGLSRAGVLHFVFGGIGFYALIAACGVFARRFFRIGRKGLAWYSIASGTFFFISFAAIASGSQAATVILTFYAAVAWIWIWHTIVLGDVRAEVRRARV
jgi:hypothetical protein